MVEDSLLINDGYVATKTIEGAPGLHPELKIVFRPALARERHVYRQKSASPDADVIEACEVALLLKHLVSVNGVELKEKERITRMRPAVRLYAVNLILGYEPEDEAADAKNSPSA